MITFANLINFLSQGLEVFGLFYSEYEAEVTKNDDPEKRHRIKVICKSVIGDKEFPKWISPKNFFMGNGRGIVHIPDIGESVLLTFKNGNPSYPIWSYRGYSKNECPKYGDNPLNFLIQTKNGTKIFVNEDDNSIEISTPNKNQILLDDDSGKITVENPDGGKIELTDIVIVSGNEIHLGGKANNGTIKIDPLVSQLNSVENIVNQLITKFNTHTHVTACGAGAGNATPTTSVQTQTATPTQKSQIENPKVKH